MVDDPGLGWHIRNIDAMREAGGWLRQDPFSLPRAGEQWYTNQWLGDLVFWAADRWAGLDGIAVVTSISIAFLFRCLYRLLLVDGLAWPVATLWTLVATLATAPSTFSASSLVRMQTEIFVIVSSLRMFTLDWPPAQAVVKLPVVQLMAGTS